MTLSVFQATITNENGDILPGAEISVIVEATGLPATIKSTRGGTALSNPFFADASGFAQFYANAGEYRIVATSGVFSRTWRYVRLGDGGAKDVGTADGEIQTNSQNRSEFAAISGGTFTTDISVSGNTVGRGGGNVATNTANGASALVANTTGYRNTANGANALNANTAGYYNTASGYNALGANTTGTNNTASGGNTLSANTTGSNNTANGRSALSANTTGGNNTANGLNALFANTTGSGNTASGLAALSANTTFNNCSGLGYNAQVTGDNQVQLGGSGTTTYAYGAVQDRSDIRDKADVRDTALGLDFINALRPVDFRWDMREDYRQDAPNADDFDSEDEYKAAQTQWLESVKLGNIEHDGTHKRSRYHHGLIAQEVKAVIDNSGIDFGGFQDHKLSGGDDVLSLGYEELIAPLIKAVQELTVRVNTLESKE